MATLLFIMLELYPGNLTDRLVPCLVWTFINLCIQFASHFIKYSYNNDTWPKSLRWLLLSVSICRY